MSHDHMTSQTFIPRRTCEKNELNISSNPFFFTLRLTTIIVRSVTSHVTTQHIYVVVSTSVQ